MPNILIYEAEQILCGRIPGRIWEGGLSLGVGCGDLQCEELVHYLVQFIES